MDETKEIRDILSRHTGKYVNVSGPGDNGCGWLSAYEAKNGKTGWVVSSHNPRQMPLIAEVPRGLLVFSTDMVDSLSLSQDGLTIRLEWDND